MENTINNSLEGLSAEHKEKDDLESFDKEFEHAMSILEDCAGYDEAISNGFLWGASFSEIASNIKDPAVAKDLEQKIRKLAEICFSNDIALSMAHYYYSCLGEEDKIIQRALRGIKRKTGFIDHTLLRLALEHGDKSKIEEYTKELMAQEKFGGFPALSGSKYFSEQQRVVGSYLDAHSAIYATPEPLSTLDSINYAREIIKLDYDLIVGVMNGGGRMAATIEALGGNVSYLEWHRNWKNGPVWREIGKNKHITNGEYEKILVIENDMVTGQTLSAIAPELKKLNGSNIDVCFVSPEVYNKYSISEIPFYSKMILIETDLPCINVYQNLKDSLEIAKTGV